MLNQPGAIKDCGSVCNLLNLCVPCEAYSTNASFLRTKLNDLRFDRKRLKGMSYYHISIVVFDMEIH